MGLDVKVLTDEHDEIKIRETDEDLDFETNVIKKDEDLKEIDVFGGGNIFENFKTEDSAFDLFDNAQDDDADFFKSLTEGTVDVTDPFGFGGNDEE